MKELDNKVTGNTLPAAEFNLPMREIQLVIEGAGGSLDETVFEQMLVAITQIATRAHHHTAGGTPTVITLTPPGGTIGLELFQDGIKVSWRPLETCPGGVISLNVNGTGPKVLTDEAGDNLIAGIYNTLQDVTARFSTGDDKWFLITPVQNQTPKSNLSDNSAFTVWQHLGTAAENFKTDIEVTAACDIPGGGTADYDIPVDRWHIISDGDDVVTVQRHTAATVADDFLDVGMQSAIALKVVIPNRKFGILQNLESWRTLALMHGTGRKASISFKVRAVNITANNLKVIKAGLVSVTGGTADVQTVTPIDTWNGDGVTPTLIAAHTFENTVASLGNPPSGSWTRLTIEDIDVDALPSAITNLKLLVWIDNANDTEAGDELYLSELKVEEGTVATPYVQEEYSVEVARCQRQFRHLGYSDNTVSDIHFDGETIGLAHFEDEGALNFIGAIFQMPTPLARRPALSDVSAVGTFFLNYVDNDGLLRKFDFPANDFDFSLFANSSSIVRAQIFKSGIDNDTHTYYIIAGNSVDGDGFVKDGVFIRMQI